MAKRPEGVEILFDSLPLVQQPFVYYLRVYRGATIGLGRGESPASGISNLLDCVSFWRES